MKPESDPLATERQFFTSLIHASIEVLDRLLHEDFVLIDVMRGGEITKSSLLDAIRLGQVQFETIEPAESRVRLYDRAAIVTGRTQMNGYFGETPFSVSSRYTHVFIKQQDRWRLVSAQGTQMAQ